MSRGKERIVVSMFMRYSRRKPKPAGCVWQGADGTQTEQLLENFLDFLDKKNFSKSERADNLPE